MYYYVKATDGEISGLGKVRQEEDDFVVMDIRIFLQECSGGYTEMNGDVLSSFIVDLVKRGEDPSAWKLWWRSHGDMGVFFSGTDENTIRKLSRDTELLSICANREGNMIGRRDSQGDSEELPVIVTPRKVGKLWKRCKREVRRKIRGINTREEVKENETITNSDNRFFDSEQIEEVFDFYRQGFPIRKKRQQRDCCGVEIREIWGL